MGNFCGLCSCIYPKFDDDEEYLNQFAVERKRRALSDEKLYISPDAMSTFSAKTSAFQSSKSLSQRRLSLASYKFNDRHYGQNPAEQIFSIYSPSRFAVAMHQDLVHWPRHTSVSSNSSIVSLNDHQLFMEVADLHMSEIKRQFKHDTLSMFTTLTRQSEDSGINMSLISNVQPSSVNVTSTSDQETPVNQRLSRPVEHEVSSSPLIYLFKTINALTSSLLKSAAQYNATGSNYLYKWSTKSSITKLRSKVFKLASFSMAALVTNTSGVKCNKSKAVKESPITSSSLFQEDTDTSIDSYSFVKTSPLRQFILRVYDANFF